jgi:hypothetical protein
MLTTVSDCVQLEEVAAMCIHVHSSYLFCAMATITKQHMCETFYVKYGKTVMETYETFKSAFREQTVC